MCIYIYKKNIYININENNVVVFSDIRFMCRKRHKIVCDGDGDVKSIESMRIACIRSYNTVVTVTLWPKKVRVVAGGTRKNNAVDVFSTLAPTYIYIKNIARH